MIEKNLGNVERVVRLMFGVFFGVWVALQPGLNGIEWFVLVVSLMLILNGVFSRCYLWFILEIDTCDPHDEECKQRSSSSCL